MVLIEFGTMLQTNHCSSEMPDCVGEVEQESDWDTVSFSSTQQWDMMSTDGGVTNFVPSSTPYQPYQTDTNDVDEPSLTVAPDSATFNTG